MRGPNHYLTQAGNLAREAEDESRRLEKFPPLDPRRAHDGAYAQLAADLRRAASAFAGRVLGPAVKP